MAIGRRVEFVMGTVVDIHVRTSPFESETLEKVLDAVLSRLRSIDRVFSTYDPRSEISRLGRGEIGIDDASSEVRMILQLCETLAGSTAGFFDMYAAAACGPASTLQASDIAGCRPIEPSGVVKGWAIEQAVELLRSCDIHDFYVEIGGDLYAGGEYAPGQPWRIGLQHPHERMKVMATLEVSNLAVATSGFYERGAHIVAPVDGRSFDATVPAELVSMTLVGTDITLTDAYATAAFAMGIQGLDWAADLSGFDVFAVDSEQRTHYSAGIDQLLVA